MSRPVPDSLTALLASASDADIGPEEVAVLTKALDLAPAILAQAGVWPNEPHERAIAQLMALFGDGRPDDPVLKNDCAYFLGLALGYQLAMLAERP